MDACGQRVCFEPMVSVVIPVYNGADYLREAIDSVLAQDYANIEILVINDGSCDDGQTEAIARGYGERIRYIAKANGGVATALNRGLKEMRGEYFAWLSHDDLYLPHRISAQIKALSGHTDKRAIVYGDYALFVDGPQIVQIQEFAKRFSVEQLNTPLFAVLHRAVHGCTVLIHRSHFERVGGFDESLLATQDYDMWFRLMRGQAICYVPGVRVHSRIHKNQGSRALVGFQTVESEALWKRLFSLLTHTEIVQLGGNEEAFFEELAREFAEETTYPQTAQLLKKRAAWARARQAKAPLDSLRTVNGLKACAPVECILVDWDAPCGVPLHSILWAHSDAQQQCTLGGALEGMIAYDALFELCAYTGVLRMAIQIRHEAGLKLACACARCGMNVIALADVSLFSGVKDPIRRASLMQRLGDLSTTLWCDAAVAEVASLYAGNCVFMQGGLMPAWVDDFITSGQTTYKANESRNDEEAASAARAYSLSLLKAAQAARIDLASAREQCAALGAEMVRMKVSTSWRMTEPLRRVRAWLGDKGV